MHWKILNFYVCLLELGWPNFTRGNLRRATAMILIILTLQYHIRIRN